MAKKLALRGFSRLKLFPVVVNTTEQYEVDEVLPLPEVQSMTKDVDSTSENIYADDMLYLNLTSFNGINSSITIAELVLETIAELGFGTFDETTKTLKGNPQGRNKEFAASFRILRADGGYRLYRWFVYTITAITESAVTTKGEGGGINPYVVDGTFTGRKVDDLPYEVKDVDVFDDTAALWLDTIPSVGNGMF